MPSFVNRIWKLHFVFCKWLHSFWELALSNYEFEKYNYLIWPTLNFSKPVNSKTMPRFLLHVLHASICLRVESKLSFDPHALKKN